MISKSGKIVLLLMAVFLTIPATLLADGGNPAPPAQYKYNPPPYMGNVTVEWEQKCTVNGNSYYEGCVFFTGTLKRAGTEGDQCVLTYALWETGVQRAVFSNHTAKDLQGRQLIGYGLGCSGLYEIIAAHSLFYNYEYTLFTVDVIVMEIATK
jgi:hypothetical protein